MAKADIKTSQKVTPMCYAYSTPEILRHNGWVKIGYTEKQSVEERIRQQTHTADVLTQLEWRGNAIFEDGSGKYFKDTEFHAYLKNCGIEYSGDTKNEWFHVDGPTSKGMFYEFRENGGIIKGSKSRSYELRQEQKKAVEETFRYSRSLNEKKEFLWNCKPRFGKTITAYDLMKKLNCYNTLIVTNRPAIANSWYADYVKFIGDRDYYFVADTDSLRSQAMVISNQKFEHIRSRVQGKIRQIHFCSLQDLKGSIYFGGTYNKLKEIKDTEWDLLIIDEAHEGVDTYKSDVAFNQISRKFTLHMSGTPFKAIASNKFSEDAIYNWTYADEQKAKREYSSADTNPYADMPKLNLFTYQMSKIVLDKVKENLSSDDEVDEYCFDLNQFFRTNENGIFIHNKEVDKFIDALTTQEKFPFSTPELRDEIKHSFWLLERIDSVRALARKLKAHPVFKDYQIIEAVGNGSADDMIKTGESLARVQYAIKHFEKTITLSVTQLTTGVTVPEWTAVMMLCNLKSPSLYMQAAFRAQNPKLFENGTECYRKENAYVFDFDPARTLIVFEEFANGLKTGHRKFTESGTERKNNIRELLNFFPVLGEDESGEMVELDAEDVLTIPRKIKSTEVVSRGFMSNFLFRNIEKIFAAPKALMDVINKCKPENEFKKREPVKLPDDIEFDKSGKPKLSQEIVIGKSKDVFGSKVYKKAQDDINSLINAEPIEKSPIEKKIEQISDIISETVKTALCPQYEENEIKPSDIKQVNREISSKVEYDLNSLAQNMKIESRTLEQEYQDSLNAAAKEGKSEEEVAEKFEQKKHELSLKQQQDLLDAVQKIAQDSILNATETLEKKVQEHKMDTVEEKIRKHLRGFARTIPSFLMAYGDENTTVENFDQIIPADVFLEVTSITLEEFRMLRDGGEYLDDEGNTKRYDGLFDEIVFNDSIKAFLAKKKELANYFDENATEDIFDYIPPQKTNQIFTPKNVVKKMVDMLDRENPGCFDDPEATFIDPYMKSGLYVAEIVKRLYRSEKMKELYPDEKQRLQHIFEKQVYGMAPTEIIYNISKNFILGFTDNIEITKHNLALCDSLPYAENGTLKEKLNELFDWDSKIKE